jgi:hypothetical protein
MVNGDALAFEPSSHTRDPAALFKWRLQPALTKQQASEKKANEIDNSSDLSSKMR